MLLFANGIADDSRDIKVTHADMDEIRLAARCELAAHLGPLGYRTDNLAT